MDNKDKTIKRLLVTRFSAMGDVAMTVPVIAALRRAYPDMKISILTRRGFWDFFRDVPDIDFIELDPFGRHKGMLGVMRLVADVKSAGVDAYADLHDVIRTKYLRRILGLAGVRIAVIDKGRSEKKELTDKSRKNLRMITPMVERYRQTFLRLGLEFEVSPYPEKANRLVPEPITELVGDKSGTWVGVAPFAKHKGKIYPISLSDKLIEILNAKYDRVFIFGGGQHEKSFAEGMEKRHEGVISVIGKMGMSEEMNLISNLDVIVTMDSATMHIASLLKVPVVSVWGATHPFVGFYGYGQNPDNAVQVDMACRPCSVFGNKPCIYGDYRCLSAITPEMIVAKVDKVLSEER